jgi:hypothetical protein
MAATATSGNARREEATMADEEDSNRKVSASVFSSSDRQKKNRRYDPVAVIAYPFDW